MNKKRFYNYFPAVLTGMLLCLFLYKNFSVSYFINDDSTMRNIASGAYTGTPDGHLIFIQYALGWIISSFYKIVPGIDWYGTILFVIHFICLIAVLGRMMELFRLRNKYLVLAVTAIIFCILDIDNVTVSFQFTTTAAICGVTALFLFLTMPRKCKKQERILNDVFITGFVVLSYCIRDKVLLMFVPFAFVVWLYRILTEKKNQKNYIVLCLGILLSLGAVAGIEKAAYKSAEWQEYTEFNRARSGIMDYYGYPAYDTHKSFYDEQGISEEQYRLLTASTLNFSTGITKEKYIEIGKYAKEVFQNERSLRARAKEALQDTVSHSLYIMKNGDQAIILLLYIMLCMLCLYQKNYKILAVLAGIFVFREMIYFYLFMKGRFLDRIYEALMLCDYAMIGGLILHSNMLAKVRLGRGKIERIVILCILVVLGGSTFSVYHNREESGQPNTETVLKEYCNADTDKRYILDLGGYSSGYDAFTVKRDASYLNYLTMYGWSCNSELYLQKKQKMQIDEIEEALLQENVYMIETASAVGGNIIDVILAYYESSGMDVSYQVIDEIQAGQYTYQVLDFDLK